MTDPALAAREQFSAPAPARRLGIASLVLGILGLLAGGAFLVVPSTTATYPSSTSL